ncbi:hypothetical protein PIB30_005510 [Stylosanthes scabra]|uniref:Uncharacterized protein n=1 Tax=Stylosanthes scabra TaxID=79078 RepID=A0ABU6Q3U2_9FABA|nr:hypothetical protein [Stylosanthes scabra]
MGSFTTSNSARFGPGCEIKEAHKITACAKLPTAPPKRRRTANGTGGKRNLDDVQSYRRRRVCGAFDGDGDGFSSRHTCVFREGFSSRRSFSSHKPSFLI